MRELAIMSTVEPLIPGNIIQLCHTMPMTCFQQEGACVNR